jgi:hypothetical protein
MTAVTSEFPSTADEHTGTAEADQNALEALLRDARAGFALESDRDGDADDSGPALPEPGAVRVQLWQSGRCLAAGQASATDRSTAVRRAAAHAAALLEKQADANFDDGSAYLVVEAVEAMQPIEPGGLSGLIASVQPGVHGLILRDGDNAVGSWPSDAIRDSDGGPRWIKSLVKAVRPPGRRLPATVRVERFTTLQTIGPLRDSAEDRPADEPSNGARAGVDTMPAAVRLIGGTRVEPVAAVTKSRLLQSSAQAGAWLMRHQLRSGLYGYEYQPGAKQWSAADSMVRQAGCAWAMAALAPTTTVASVRRSANLAVAGIAHAYGRRDGPGGLFYFRGKTGPARLGTIPLFVMAASELGPRAPLPKDTLDRLTATMEALQRRDGSFGTEVRGLTFEGSETYFAGQLTLALARRHTATKRRRTGQAVERALSHYRTWWDAGNQDLSFLAWMIQACDTWHSVTGDQAASEFAFAMADWALPFQHARSHPNPQWIGAYEGSPGIGTAAYTEGMLRALATARRVGDHERVERYQESVVGAFRFLLQLTLEPADLAFIGGKEHRGAVRSSLRRHTLRCDNAQHFLMAALVGAALLTPDDYEVDQAD